MNSNQHQQVGQGCSAAESSLLSNLLMLIAVDTVCCLWGGLCDDYTVRLTKLSARPLSSLLRQLLLPLQVGCSMLGWWGLLHNFICVKDALGGRGPVQCHATSIWAYLHVSHHQPKLSTHMQLLSFKAGVPLAIHCASSASLADVPLSDRLFWRDKTGPAHT